MIAITLSVNIKPFSGSSGGPATLTITFGEGVTSDGTFYLTINGVEYSISFGQSGSADVPIYQDNEGNLEAYNADYIANAFSSYITSTFSSSLTVTRPTANVVTLTTVATSGASLSAVCSLPIFPNVPLGGTTSYLKLANNTDFLLLADNSSKLILN
jgi:hypothetical protein